MKLSGEYIYNTEFAKKLSLEFTASGSDKGSHHGYDEIYSLLLADREPASLLEIGLFLGDTQHTDLFAWEKIFPNADIYGADIKQDLLFNTGNIKTFFVDQSNPPTFSSLKGKLPPKVDIIIDDASHVYDMTIETFENMFEIVSDGGIYIIEDSLFGDYNTGSYEQRAGDLEKYFIDNGYKCEAYASSKVHSCVDSVIVAIVKE